MVSSRFGLYPGYTWQENKNKQFGEFGERGINCCSVNSFVEKKKKKQVQKTKAQNKGSRTPSEHLVSNNLIKMRT